MQSTTASHKSNSENDPYRMFGKPQGYKNISSSEFILLEKIKTTWKHNCIVS